MARVTKGEIPTVFVLGGIDTQISLQPGRTINEKNDGTLEGQAIFKCDKSYVDNIPKLKSLHPDDDRLEAYDISKTYNSNGLVTVVVSYFGLTASKTDPVITYSGGQNNEPIETHPNFVKFAGTVNAPLNGAKFVTEGEDRGAFIGFTEDTAGEDAALDKKQFRGIEYYLTPSTQITVSYWQDKVPALKDRLTITKRIKGINSQDLKKPSNVKDFLLLDTPYRQVGSFYQVTEQYLGSGPAGWNDEIYEDA